VSLPIPRIGLVIRYNFLWSHEKAAGKDEAAKDRPAAIVVATRNQDGEVRVIVAPITHEAPADPLDSIEISSSVRAVLGLDDHPQWLRLDELNRFTWPGYDLRPVPGSQRRYDYGMLPRALFGRLRERLLARQRTKSVSIQSRD
jgi:hypothetical protein